MRILLRILLSSSPGPQRLLLQHTELDLTLQRACLSSAHVLTSEER